MRISEIKRVEAMLLIPYWIQNWLIVCVEYYTHTSRYVALIRGGGATSVDLLGRIVIAMLFPRMIGIAIDLLQNGVEFIQ